MEDATKAKRKGMSDLKSKNMAFHEAHIKEFARMADFMGNKSSLSHALGRSSSYVTNIIEDNEAGQYLRPGDYYALKFLVHRKVDEQIRSGWENQQPNKDLELFKKRFETLKKEFGELMKNSGVG